MPPSGRIPQSFIDDLVGRVDIVDVINDRVQLKKAGHEFKACCPFHDEKTPSFTVSPSKQFYYCFGCGAHGTVLGFLMDYERLEFVDAIEELAGRLGLEVPRDGTVHGSSVAASRNEALYAVLEAAQTFFTRQLRQHVEAARAVVYLKGRGLSGEIARDFGLGYAPPGWDNLVKALRQSHGEEALVDSGLAIRSERGSVYDRFRERVVFPIRDSRGRVIAYGGRVLKPEDTPKYLNSPETPLFHKGRELYGLWEARRANRQLDRLLVVEGYMDVVALAQHGLRYGVATLGTAATADHVERLFRSTSNVVFAFDGDAAGRRAAERALDTVLPTLRDGREVGFLFLPEGDDPDTLVRARGADALSAMARESVSALEFLFNHLSRELKASPESFGKLVEQASSRLAAVPGEAVREVALERLARTAGVQRAWLDETAARAPAGSNAASSREIYSTPRAPERSPGEREPTGAGFDGQPQGTRVRHAIRLLLHFPAVAAAASGDWRQLCTLEKPGVPLLLAMIELLRERPNLSLGAVLEHFREDREGRHLARIAAGGAPPGDESQMTAEFRDVMKGLHDELDEQRFRLLSAKSRVGTLSDEEREEFLVLVSKAPGARRGEPVGR